MTDKEFQSEYAALLHAVQTGLMFEMSLLHQADPARNPDPESAAGRALKHLRTGLNGVMCDTAALAKLLIERGVITDDEYKSAVLAGLRGEKARLEGALSEQLRTEIKLH